MKRHLLVVVALILIGSVVLWASGDREKAAASKESVLRVAIDNDLKILDPHFTTAFKTRDHGYLVYDTLFAMDSGGKVQPQMVGEYSASSDGLGYEFTLREGLKWHDGADVTAADCVASIKRWGSGDSLGQMMMANVASIQTTGAKSFSIRMSSPFDVISAMGKPGATVPFILPERLAQKPVSEQIEDPTGSGPYKMIVDQWIPGKQIVYEKHEQYKPRPGKADWFAGGKVARLDRVEMLYMPDASTTLAALTAGEIDMIQEVPMDLIPVVEKNPNVEVNVLDPLGWQTVLRINHLQPPFDRIEARQAVMWAVDQKKYMDVLYGNPEYYRTSPAMFISGGPYETDAGTQALVNRDLEKARSLVEQSGYKGHRVVILDPTDQPDLHAAALLTAENLRAIGFESDLHAMDFSTLLKRRQVKKPIDEGGWNIFHTAFGSVDMMNPLTNPALNASCEGNYPGWPCNEKIQNLLRDFTAETDKSAKMKIATQLQVEAVNHVTHIWFGQYQNLSAASKKLTGILKAPFPLYYNIDKE